MASAAAVFFDRDGTLISDTGYISCPEDVRLLPGAVDLLKYLRKSGYLLVVVSNQSGVGRGLITELQAAQVHERFISLLAQQGVLLNGIFYCPHAPEIHCDCRKPLPGMLLKAAEQLDIDLARSYMIGDKPSDCEAGQAAGCNTFLLGPSRSGSTLEDLLMVFQAEINPIKEGTLYETR